MKLSLLAALTTAFAFPINTETIKSVESVNTDAMVPLIFVNDDGSLWVGSDAKQKLMSTEAKNALAAIAFAEDGHASKIGTLQRRGLCCDSCSCDSSSNDCCDNSCDPCNDSCEPCDDPCCDSSDSSCCCGSHREKATTDPCNNPSKNGCCNGPDELRASCYARWFCPSTYCGANFCPEDECHPRGNHPIVDNLRSYCISKWACPKTYCCSGRLGGSCCNSGGCCTNGGCCCDSSDSCEDSCYDPCYEPCEDPCYDPCADSCETPCNDPCAEPCNNNHGHRFCGSGC